MSKEQHEIVLKGIPAAPGIAIGQAYLFVKQIPQVEERALAEDEIEQEIARLGHAVAKSDKELTKILSFAQEKLGAAKAKIFEAQIMILHDPYLNETIRKRIREEKRNAEFVVSTEVAKYERLMLAAHDDYMHERAHDVDDLKNRIVRNLQEEKLISRLEGSPVIVSHSLTPADTMILSRNDVLGYATDLGGITSHAALLSRSLKIPAVVGLHDVSHQSTTGDPVILDGYSGILIVRPTKDRVKEYEQKRDRFRKFEAKLSGFRDLPAKTTDGHEITLASNIELEEEIEYVHLQGSRGVGLYRTESLLIGRETLPSGEEQYQNYNKIADRLYPHLVIMRTFDVGGDKVLAQQSEEANPFLGWRGIRVSLDRPALFHEQLRAMLRASTRKNVAIMFPMVASVWEVRKAIELVAHAKADLKAHRHKFDDKIQIGAMIEVPSAALMAEEIASEVDFLSIGTNDLIQYLLAVDRGNATVAKLYQEFHPAVLRTIKSIIEAGHKQGKWVGMCGEMAGNPLATILLLGFGLDEFSVIPSVLPEIKKIVRSVSLEQAKRIADLALSLSNEEEIKRCLVGVLRKECPDVPLATNTL
jgi:phosphotransferase system enzyme I (PtsI)